MIKSNLRPDFCHTISLYSSENVDRNDGQLAPTAAVISHDSDENLHSTTKLITLPRIMKRDIRRIYANMFTNVSNSMDIETAAEFYTHFTNNQFVYKMTIADSVTPHLQDLTEFIGLPVYLQYIYNRLQICPDVVHKMTNMRIDAHQENADESIITFQLDVEMTKLIDIPFAVILPVEGQVIENKLEDSVDKKRKHDTDNSEVNPFENESNYDHTVANLIQNAPRIQKVLNIYIKGTITMFLDSNKFIREMRYNCVRSMEQK